jgi:hypothetical protein
MKRPANLKGPPGVSIATEKIRDTEMISPSTLCRRGASGRRFATDDAAFFEANPREYYHIRPWRDADLDLVVGSAGDEHEHNWLTFVFRDGTYIAHLFRPARGRSPRFLTLIERALEFAETYLESHPEIGRSQ